MESLISHSLACYNKRKNVLPMNLKEQQQHILSGAMYNDLTPELVEAREKTVFLTNCYNASFGQPASERHAILKEVLKSVGKMPILSRIFVVSSATISASGTIFMQILTVLCWTVAVLRLVTMSFLDRASDSTRPIMLWMLGSVVRGLLCQAD